MYSHLCHLALFQLFFNELTLSLKAVSSKGTFYKLILSILEMRFSISYFIWKLQFKSVLVKNHPRLLIYYFIFLFIIFCTPLLFSIICILLPFFRAFLNCFRFWLEHKNLIEFSYCFHISTSFSLFFWLQLLFLYFSQILWKFVHDFLLFFIWL